MASPQRDPYIQYQAVEFSRTPIAENEQQAIAIANATALDLLPGKRLKTEITTADPRIRDLDSLANYKLFKFEGGAGDHYELELRSLCNCFGLDKFVMYPIARIIDPQGEVLNDEWTYIDLENPSWSYPVTLTLTPRWQQSACGRNPVFAQVGGFESGSLDVAIGELLERWCPVSTEPEYPVHEYAGFR